MLTRWFKRNHPGTINEDPELKPRRNEATVFFTVGIALVVVAIVIMSIVGAIMRSKEQQAPLQDRTNVTNVR